MDATATGRAKEEAANAPARQGMTFDLSDTFCATPSCATVLCAMVQTTLLQPRMANLLRQSVLFLERMRVNDPFSRVAFFERSRSALAMGILR